MEKLIIRIIIQLVCIVSLSTQVMSQEIKPEKKWKFLIEPYLIFPAMSGEIGFRNLPAVEVNPSAGDILSKLKLGGMLYLEAQTDKWAITSDFLFMNLEQAVTPTALITSGTARADQYLYELGGLYRFAPFLEAGIGGRLNTVSAELQLDRKVIGGTEAISGSLSETWIDPIIITRLTADVNDKWLFDFRGDFGGMGIGSTFTWQIQANVGYRFSRVFQTTIGYRLLGMDYDKGTGEDRFRYDVLTYGPNIRFGFNL